MGNFTIRPFGRVDRSAVSGGCRQSSQLKKNEAILNDLHVQWQHLLPRGDIDSDSTQLPSSSWPPYCQIHILLQGKNLIILCEYIYISLNTETTSVSL